MLRISMASLPFTWQTWKVRRGPQSCYAKMADTNDLLPIEYQPNRGQANQLSGPPISRQINSFRIVTEDELGIDGADSGRATAISHSILFLDLPVPRTGLWPESGTSNRRHRMSNCSNQYFTARLFSTENPTLFATRQAAASAQSQAMSMQFPFLFRRAEQSCG